MAELTGELTAGLTVRAPAKINLHLGVGAPREDGFHPLETVYHAIGICDDVTARSAEEWRLALTAEAHVEQATVPLDGDNIVDRAARLLADLHGVPVRGDLSIHKSIPVAGGMAGGSADAAAALVAFDRLWELNTTDEDLLRLAAELGSDVPFALLGGNALGTGRGEVVEPLPGDVPLWWVVVPSAEGLSTPAVYRHWDELFPDAPAAPAGAGPLIKALAAGDVLAIAAALHNDLEAAALDLRPDLGRLIAEGEAAGALRGMVSGSGPTVVFLCPDAPSAHSLAGRVAAFSTRVAGSDAVLVAHGPVAGAHLIEVSRG